MHKGSHKKLDLKISTQNLRLLVMLLQLLITVFLRGCTLFQYFLRVALLILQAALFSCEWWPGVQGTVLSRIPSSAYHTQQHTVTNSAVSKGPGKGFSG